MEDVVGKILVGFVLVVGIPGMLLLGYVVVSLIIGSRIPEALPYLLAMPMALGDRIVKRINRFLSRGET